MKPIKIDYRIAIILCLLLFPIGFNLFVTYNARTEGNKNENLPLNLSDTNSQYINSVTVNYGSVGTGSLSYTHVDDANYMQYNAEYYEAPFFAYGCDLSLNFNPPLIGDDYKLSVHIETSISSVSVSLYVNSQTLESSNNIDFNLRAIDDVTSITLSASDISTDFSVRIYYFKLDLIETSINETWYESFENHDLGYFDDPNWTEKYGSSYLTIVDASTYGVNMDGNALRMAPPGWSSYTEIEQYYGNNLHLNAGDCLYLKFRIQINKDGYGSHAIIKLTGDGSYNTFFQLLIGTSSEVGYIGVRLYDLNEIILADTIENQVYDFDIFFIKQQDSNIVSYNIFMNQVLQQYRQVNVGDLYPHTTTITYEMYDDGPGEFFLDNFYIGEVGTDVSDPYYAKTVFPIYYLYSPVFQSDQYVADVQMRYSFEEIEQLSVEFAFTIGVGFESFGISTQIPLGEAIMLVDSYQKYEVATHQLDIIIYVEIEAYITDLTIYLPGVDPKTGTSLFKGNYNFEFLNQQITSKDINYFQNIYGELPQSYYDCKNQAEFDKYKIYEANGGSQTETYPVDRRVTSNHWEFDLGLSLGFMIGLDIGVDFGINFHMEYTQTFISSAEIDVSWNQNTPEGEQIAFELSIPSSYPAGLNLPPYSANQVSIDEFIPPKVTGLVATGGAKQVAISWNSVSNIDYYKIYRDGMAIATTTSTSYTDKNLADSTSYTYRVAAVNVVDSTIIEGPSSDSKTAITNDAPDTPGFTDWILLTMLTVGMVLVVYRFHLKMKKLK